MRLTLDLDRCSRKRLIGVIKLLHLIFPTCRVVARRSPGGRGYHVIAYKTGLPPEEIKNFRRWLGDDPLRRLFDRHRGDVGIETQILFSSKPRRTRNGLVMMRAVQIYDSSKKEVGIDA